MCWAFKIDDNVQYSREESAAAFKRLRKEKQNQTGQAVDCKTDRSTRDTTTVDQGGAMKKEEEGRV